MRVVWLISLFVLAALGAFTLTRAIDGLVPEPPAPVHPIDIPLTPPTTEAGVLIDVTTDAPAGTVGSA